MLKILEEDKSRYSLASFWAIRGHSVARHDNPLNTYRFN